MDNMYAREDIEVVVKDTKATNDRMAAFAKKYKQLLEEQKNNKEEE